jgi:hypothetical protein
MFTLPVERLTIGRGWHPVRSVSTSVMDSRWGWCSGDTVDILISLVYSEPLASHTSCHAIVLHITVLELSACCAA